MFFTSYSNLSLSASHRAVLRKEKDTINTRSTPHQLHLDYTVTEKRLFCSVKNIIFLLLKCIYLAELLQYSLSILHNCFLNRQNALLFQIEKSYWLKCIKCVPSPSQIPWKYIHFLSLSTKCLSSVSLPTVLLQAPCIYDSFLLKHSLLV